ncbi:MAG: hypothetical protein R2851_00540 [Caldilineaceae bacterium]
MRGRRHGLAVFLFHQLQHVPIRVEEEGDAHVFEVARRVAEGDALATNSAWASVLGTCSDVVDATGRRAGAGAPRRGR